jgi:hypothetical protein
MPTSHVNEKMATRSSPGAHRDTRCGANLLVAVPANPESQFYVWPTFGEVAAQNCGDFICPISRLN